ncbi:MAG: sigma-54-dependent transcriptional regulator [Candidatus Methylomirabilales bacterium]
MAHEEILIVDDEPNILKVIKDILVDEGYRVRTVQSGEEALKLMQKATPDAIILDIWLPGIDGLQTLEAVTQLGGETPVIMISGHGSIETAVRAIKLGAFDFIEKPPTIERTLLAVQHALETRRLIQENRALRERLQERYEIVGQSPEILHLRQIIAAAAPSNGRVLIRGESGTGKELVARAIHRESLRRGGPFVTVNCAAIPEELIESELFGHERGAFTGATAQREGKFAMADGGTLFLDEIGDMSLKTQAKVLRVLQEQVVERVGGTDLIRIDVRVIAASNKDLEAGIRQARFREDLYYRLNVIPIEVPPLRKHRDDIGPLAEHFLGGFCAEYGKRSKRLSPEALQLLRHHAWPGNVRELKNVIERLVIMVSGETVEGRDVVPMLQGRPIGGEGDGSRVDPSEDIGSLRQARARFEQEYIVGRLREFGWNITRTAEHLGIERSNLHRKMKVYGIGGLASPEE